MCKYCEFTYVNEHTGEKSNECKPILHLRNGHQTMYGILYRYRSGESKKSRSNMFILNESVELGDGIHTVVEKSIKIKYCPFCGEEL